MRNKEVVYADGRGEYGLRVKVLVLCFMFFWVFIGVVEEGGFVGCYKTFPFISRFWDFLLPTSSTHSAACWIFTELSKSQTRPASGYPRNIVSLW